MTKKILKISSEKFAGIEKSSTFATAMKK